MRIVPDIKATFGDTYFLGYSEKKKFDTTSKQKSAEPESYLCKIASSKLQGQLEVIVPLTVSVDEIKFNQKVVLEDMVIDPYARCQSGSNFAQVIFRCTAKSMTPESIGKPISTKDDGQK